MVANERAASVTFSRSRLAYRGSELSDQILRWRLLGVTPVGDFYQVVGWEWANG